MPLKIGSDRGHPFLKPLWRRIALVAATGLWAAFEIIFERDEMWMILSGGLFAYGVWVFLLTWPKDDAEGGEKAEDKAGGDGSDGEEN